MDSPQAIAAPPKEMLEMMIMQLETAIESFPAPQFVVKAGKEFIESLKAWSAGRME
jgi:hypothetical protein